jgi:hypothetical protein
MSFTNSTRFEILNKSNYDTWKIQVKALLIKNDTWSYEYVSGEKPKPKLPVKVKFMTQNGTVTDRAQGFVRGSGVGSVKGRQATGFLKPLMILLSWAVSNCSGGQVLIF